MSSTEAPPEETFLPTGRKVDAVADRLVLALLPEIVTKGSCCSSFKNTPAVVAIEADLGTLGSSGEKAVSRVSGVPPIESALPVELYGEYP